MLDRNIKAEPPPVYGLILAAGLSRRFPPNKLLMEMGGVPVLERVAEAVTASSAAATVAVTGHHADRIGTVLERFLCLPVFNPDYARGMGYSVARGVEFIGEKFAPPPAAGVLLCLGDEPLITTPLIDRVIAAYGLSAGSIVMPARRGRRGHPAVFPFGLISRSLDVVRERGAREVIRLHPEKVRELEVPERVVAADIDTPEDYRRVLSEFRKKNE